MDFYIKSSPAFFIHMVSDLTMYLKLLGVKHDDRYLAFASTVIDIVNSRLRYSQDCDYIALHHFRVEPSKIPR
jgi:hypothetical protein